MGLNVCRRQTRENGRLSEATADCLRSAAGKWRLSGAMSTVLDAVDWRGGIGEEGLECEGLECKGMECAGLERSGSERWTWKNVGAERQAASEALA
jgi:hypothetical protein